MLYVNVFGLTVNVFAILLIVTVYVALAVFPLFESVAVIVIEYAVLDAGVFAAIVKFLPLKLK